MSVKRALELAGRAVYSEQRIALAADPADLEFWQDSVAHNVHLAKMALEDAHPGVYKYVDDCRTGMDVIKTIAGIDAGVL